MNCFVIMPFAREFDDVYATILAAVESACKDNSVNCFRLDASRPAGRITERLEQEIKSAALCVADLTGSRPNIMWEVGYAMASGKPTILITQDGAELPFDIRDMETLRYDRNHLGGSLGQPLKRMLIDTLSKMLTGPKGGGPRPSAQDDLIGELLTQLRELRAIVSQSVKSWSPTPADQQTSGQISISPEALEGAWVNEESGTHAYVRLVGGELVAPYCYAGNDELSSAYYGWKKIGEFWFARYSWFNRPISGFAFLKQDSVDQLSGAWWLDDQSRYVPDNPNLNSGISSRWNRRPQATIPTWALQFFEDIRREGVVNRMTRRQFEGMWGHTTDTQQIDHWSG